MRILDVGCGYGAKIRRLGKRGEVIGIDISDEALEIARKTFPGTKFLKMDAAKLDFPNAHFDEVHCYDVLEHVDDLKAVIGEIKRVLKPGGSFVVEMPIERGSGSSSQRMSESLHHVNEMAPEEFLKFINNHGFEASLVKGVRFYGAVYWSYARLKGRNAANQQGDINYGSKTADDGDIMNKTLMLLATLNATPYAELKPAEIQLLEKSFRMPIQEIILFARLIDEVGSRIAPQAYRFECKFVGKPLRQDFAKLAAATLDKRNLQDVMSLIKEKRLEEQGEEIRKLYEKFAEQEHRHASDNQRLLEKLAEQEKHYSAKNAELLEKFAEQEKHYTTEMKKLRQQLDKRNISGGSS